MTLLIRNFTKNKINARELEKVEDAVLKEEKIKEKTEISLVFVGGRKIRELNKIYRGVDKITDVLSFEGRADDKFVEPEDGISYLGEIFICYKKAKEQACEKGHSVGREIDILFVHGLLHLLGYDHIKDKDYKVMNKKEARILRKLQK